MTLRLSLILAGALLLASGSATAHHGWASFDSNTMITLEGVVTEFHFVNPHSVVEFEVKNESGKLEVWQGELTSAARLTPKGWKATSLEAGDKISVSGNRARSGVRMLRIRKLLTAHGELDIVLGN